MRNQKIAELLHQYFELGVAEGREGRNHDTEAGDAQRVLSEIEAEIAAIPTGAKPVAWINQQELRYLEMVSGNNGWGNHLRSVTLGGEEEGRSPLYAAPPAPSVAVKGLDWSGFKGIQLNKEWLPDDQDLIYTALGVYDGDGDMDDDAREQIIERLLAAWKRSALSAQVQDVATAQSFADRMFKLHGFMLSEEYRGNPAVTITFPDNRERNEFYSAIVELSTHKTPAPPAKQEG